MDPITIPIALALTGFSCSVGNRLASKYISTPFEKAQKEGVEVQKKRLQEERERHDKRLAFERERHLEEISARFALQVQQDRLTHWPLSVGAEDIILRSAANLHDALNVFTVIRASKSSATTELLQQLLHETHKWTKRYYAEGDSTHPTIAYINPLRPHAPAGEAFVSTVYGMLKYEPVLLFEIHCLSEQKVYILPIHWGFGRDFDKPPLTLGSVEMTLSGDRVKDMLQMRLIVHSYMAGIIDVFHLTNKPDCIERPIIYQTIIEEADERFLNLFSSPAEIASLLPPIYEIYHKSAPKVGLQLAKRLINQFYNAGQHEIAQCYFSSLCTQICNMHGYDRSGHAWNDISGIDAIRHFFAPSLTQLCRKLSGENILIVGSHIPMADRGFND